MRISLSLLTVASTATAAVVQLPSRTLHARDIADISLVRTIAINIATRSWELGTLAEALLELDYSSLSVFGDNALPPPVYSTPDVAPQEVLNIATTVVASKPTNLTTLVDGDGAVGDPASLGSVVLLANWTYGDAAYSSAASEQLNYLLYTAPRAPSGAISHRTDQAQLWADFMYMAPPFIAYYGALIGGDYGTYLVREAVNQSSLYRDALFDQDAGLWRHVALGDWQDTNHWATGNGWAAAGMLRVLMTVSIYSAATGIDFSSEQSSLTGWINETLSGVWSHQQADGSLLNYVDQDASVTFLDTSSTALLAATSFRFATVTNTTAHTAAAAEAYRLVQSNIDASGYLWNTVDPLTFSSASAAGAASPEGQSFVLMLEAAVDACSATQTNQVVAEMLEDVGLRLHPGREQALLAAMGFGMYVFFAGLCC
ncbi:glycosyl hydrolase family 88-domain-containing protein [Amylostereum chailletii]|nr:glycosyl hydrolase family 88-domain-containing protein [Amylostereum chailletii]